ncbi:carbohydrate-binding protein, partial [Kibdelosporangium lantanae]
VTGGIVMADNGVPAWLAVIGALVLGATVGAVNGILVVLTRINGFIVTLATMTILTGLQYQIVGTATVYTGGQVVAHNGHKWRAKWWTQGEEPGTTGQWGVWEDQGAC